MNLPKKICHKSLHSLSNVHFPKSWVVYLHRQKFRWEVLEHNLKEESITATGVKRYIHLFAREKRYLFLDNPPNNTNSVNCNRKGSFSQYHEFLTCSRGSLKNSSKLTGSPASSKTSQYSKASCIEIKSKTVQSGLWNYEKSWRDMVLKVPFFHCRETKTTFISGIKVYIRLGRSESSDFFEI